MLINSKVFAVALIFGASASPTMADSFYGALDFGQTMAKDACTVSAGITVTGCKDSATLFRVAGGYQFAQMWGAEVSYSIGGKASLGTEIGPGGTASGDWQTSSLQISGTGTFPLGDAFALIGKVGIARTDIKLTGTCSCGEVNSSATSNNLAFGIGAQYDFTKSVAVRAQYEDLGTVGDANTTGTAKVTLLSAGVVYKF